MNGEKLRELPYIRNKKGCPLSQLLFNIVLETFARAVRQEQDMKRIQIGKELKLSLFLDDVILYLEDPKNSAKRLRAD